MHLCSYNKIILDIILFLNQSLLFCYKEVVCILESSPRKVPLYTVGIMKISRNYCVVSIGYLSRMPLSTNFPTSRTRGRYLSHTTALSVISRYTTVFSCCGTPLSFSVISLLPRCHSRGYPIYTPLPIAAGGYGRINPAAHQRVAMVTPTHHSRLITT